MINISPSEPQVSRAQEVRQFVAATFGTAATDDHSFKAVLANPNLLCGCTHPKVLLTGTFASGKTTIFDIIRLLDNVHALQESARPLLDKFPELETKPDFQHLLLNIQASAELEACQWSKAPIVLDRGFLDILVYSKYFQSNHLLPDLVPLIRYEHIFLCSPDEIDVSHLYAPNDLCMRSSLNDLFRDTLQQLEIPHTILKGSTRDRLAVMSEQLRYHPIAKSLNAEFELQ